MKAGGALFIFTERAAEAYNAALSILRNGGDPSELQKLLQILENEKALLRNMFVKSLSQSKTRDEVSMRREGLRVLDEMINRIKMFLGAGAPVEAFSSAS
ncbi:MAG: hypothetical protein QW318_03475 [Candidatus Caldarchaeum sp.]|uniref:Uncharacterized protein n=1 Tax=Caldiarchaeum subterraneum TaxID=311458 RepID=A0A7J3G4I2_CALS0